MANFLRVFLLLASLLLIAIFIYAPYVWGSDLYEKELGEIVATKRGSPLEERIAAKRNEERLANIRRNYPYHERQFIWGGETRISGAPFYLTVQRQIVWSQVFLESIVALLAAFGLSLLLSRWPVRLQAGKPLPESTSLTPVVAQNEKLKVLFLALVHNPDAAEPFRAALLRRLRQSPAQASPSFVLQQVGKLAEQTVAPGMDKRFCEELLQELEIETAPTR
ncbi:MAG TPA: hypothetical protein VFZ34_25760 [Blastocatellia bacterium]|nr:hypothetical protein [Blastocatellia bacterium]